MTDISFATPADLTDLHAMIHALSAFHGDEAQVTLEQMRDIFFSDHPKAEALVAKEDGVVVGYAGLTSVIVIHENSLWIDIHHLFVVENMRAKGIGKALIKAARAHARDLGATRLTIGTDPRNASAIAAYRATAILQEMKDPGPRFRVDLSG